MQIDIITKNSVELKANDTKVTTISSNENRIETTVIVKTGITERTYKLIAWDKNGEPKLRAE